MSIFSCLRAKERGKECAKSCTDCDVSHSDISPSSSDTSVACIKEKDDNDRGNWTGKMDFLLSCIGYAVGLGNIWRFPYLCYRSGGGAFLIPYLIFLVLCGLPMFFLEISMGQFCSSSPITMFRYSPIFKGVGYGMVIISGIVCIYYNIIITWTLYYLFMSFRAILPWSTCDNPWNTVECTISRNKSVENATMFNVSGDGLNTTYAIESNLSRVTASEEYWRRHVLNISDGIEDIGGIRWELLLCLALAWILVFLCLCKGVKSSGKVVYVTATFPYAVLLILLIRGVTLEGAWDGIYFYLVPQWDKLLTFKVWGDAAVQIFYSVGMSWGGIITMASYNKFSNNVYRDALIVPILNCGTSIFAGLVIFSILGNMAYITGVDISKVVTEGPGLTFVVYPEAVTNLPISPLWAILFFLMLLTIGLDSQFGMFETMTSAFMDEFPQYLKQNKKMTITAAMCFFEFLLGLPCITRGGAYILQIMDWYCSCFSLMILSIIEVTSIAWIYGAKRFYKDIALMIGFQPNKYWMYMWMFVTPLTTSFIWLFSIITLKPVTYGDYEYPGWAIVFGWFLAACSLLPTPIVAIYEISKQEGTFVERVQKAARPAKNWGPSQPEDKERYIASLTHSERRFLDDSPLSSEGLILRTNSPAVMNGEIITCRDDIVLQEKVPLGLDCTNA